MRHPFFEIERPVVLGHRGSAGTHPENTLESFAAALEQGAHVLESDVHVTRDGIPILLHDPSVERVTEGEGQAARLRFEELRALDAGYRFVDAQGEHSARGRGHRIPSLEEAFARFPAARFNLEIKCRDLSAIEATLDLIDRFDRSDRTLLAAGEDDVMRDLRRAVARHAAEPAMGASLGEIVAAIASALGRGPMPEGVMALQIPPEFADRPLATTELIEHAHAHEVEVHVWTVNDLHEIETLLGSRRRRNRDRPARPDGRMAGTLMTDRHAEIDPPSAFFMEQAARLLETAEIGPVLDLACGSGRHSLAAAALGLDVLAVDRNAEALARLAAQTPSAGRIRVQLVDLEGESPPPLPEAGFGAVLVFRYLHRPRVAWIEALLRPGGLLLYETFTTAQRSLGWGPGRDEFLLEPGELPKLFAGLEIEHYEEGLTTEARPARTARLVASKPR